MIKKVELKKGKPSFEELEQAFGNCGSCHICFDNALGSWEGEEEEERRDEEVSDVTINSKGKKN